MNNRDCNDCKFCGFDIADGPYCVHPSILGEYRWGLLLHNGNMKEYCPMPEKPLFEPKEQTNEK
jgi:hypothetical protein